ncbi:MAG: flagellar biosynthetic protein FliO, partial [Cycloclasticus sp.]|nr:flagellar biosynthetic protein FliO [Cycloclasticus sp. 46_83_sub15_T18]
MLRLLYSLLLSLFMSAALAAPTVIGSESVDPLSTANLTQWTVGLLFVLLLIIAAAWLARRFSGFSAAQAGQLKVLSGVSLGGREKALLIRAGKQHILLGVSPGQVINLHTFAEGEIEQSAPVSASGFQASLQKMMTQQAAK